MNGSSLGLCSQVQVLPVLSLEVLNHSWFCPRLPQPDLHHLSAPCPIRFWPGQQILCFTKPQSLPSCHSSMPWLSLALSPPVSSVNLSPSPDPAICFSPWPPWPLNKATTSVATVPAFFLPAPTVTLYVTTPCALLANSRHFLIGKQHSGQQGGRWEDVMGSPSGRL